jgi:uncharacterized protein YdaU (DUF1376 family)
MSLRNQPYFPLYVQDFLTDEKLNECSAQSTGVYIKIMCIMHKSEEYGTILLKQKDKQKSSTVENFAYKLLKHLPFDFEVIRDSITELINESVLTIEGDKLFQKRMVRDNDISEKRSLAGSEGGKRTQFAKAKVKANTEYEDEAEDVVDLPFKSVEFSEKWNEYTKFRSENRYPKFKPTGLKNHFLRLMKLCEGNEQTAIAIYDEAMANNYQGIFPLKEAKNGANKKPGQSSAVQFKIDDHGQPTRELINEYIQSRNREKNNASLP